MKVIELLENTQKRFIYVSAERGLAVAPRYLQTKREVEEYLRNNNTRLKSVIIRPGVMYSEEDKLKTYAAFAVNLINHADGVFNYIGLQNVS